jgi:hypothetical protein
VFRAAEDASHPRRFVPAADFRLVMLPEPEHLDGTRPELGWLKLDLRVGQSHVFHNPPFVDVAGGGSPPRQPAHTVGWDRCRMKPAWEHEEPLPGPQSFPAEWAQRVHLAPGQPARSAVTLHGSAESRPPGS